MDHPYYLSARVALLFYETARDSLSSQRLRFPRVLILRTLPSVIIWCFCLLIQEEEELKNKNTNKNKKLIHRRLRVVLRAIGSVDVSGGDGAAVVCLLFRPPATELNKIIDKN